MPHQSFWWCVYRTMQLRFLKLGTVLIYAFKTFKLIIVNMTNVTHTVYAYAQIIIEPLYEKHWEQMIKGNVAVKRIDRTMHGLLAPKMIVSKIRYGGAWGGGGGGGGYGVGELVFSWGTSFNWYICFTLSVIYFEAPGAHPPPPLPSPVATSRWQCLLWNPGAWQLVGVNGSQLLPMYVYLDLFLTQFYVLIHVFFLWQFSREPKTL